MGAQEDLGDMGQDMEELKKRLREKEGLRLKPYQDDTGNITIGFGHNLATNGISWAVAEQLLDEDLYHASDRYFSLPKEIQERLNHPRRRVLVELIFWLGFKGLLRFEMMLKAIKAADFEKAADALMDSKIGRTYTTRTKELADALREG